MIVSCSNDEGSVSNTNPNSIAIVGTWKAIKAVDVCSTGSEQVFNLSSCEQMGRTIFSENGTLVLINYTETLFNCEQSSSFNGTWFLDGENLTITTDQTYDYSFFEVTDSTLRLGDYDSSQNLTCDGGNPLSHYYTEFEKVE